MEQKPTEQKLLRNTRWNEWVFQDVHKLTNNRSYEQIYEVKEIKWEKKEFNISVQRIKVIKKSRRNS